MQLFYAYEVHEKHALLDAEETRHCMRTLRKKVGDKVRFTDGMGYLYEGSIRSLTKKQCVLDILSKTQTQHLEEHYLHLVIAPTKNISRIEWLLEKATELGVQKISLILCKHSERKKVREDRLQKIIISAAKQSLQTAFPRLESLVTFKEVLETYTGFKNKYIAHCQSGNLEHFKTLIPKGEEVCILIGPEGDFSAEEVDVSLKYGFVSVGLGATRLRTETAGLYACSIVAALNS